MEGMGCRLRSSDSILQPREEVIHAKGGFQPSWGEDVKWLKGEVTPSRRITAVALGQWRHGRRYQVTQGRVGKNLRKCRVWCFRFQLACHC